MLAALIPSVLPKRDTNWKYCLLHILVLLVNIVQIERTMTTKFVNCCLNELYIAMYSRSITSWNFLIPSSEFLWLCGDWSNDAEQVFQRLDFFLSWKFSPFFALSFGASFVWQSLWRWNIFHLLQSLKNWFELFTWIINSFLLREMNRNLQKFLGSQFSENLWRDYRSRANKIESPLIIWNSISREYRLINLWSISNSLLFFWRLILNADETSWAMPNNF
jgi:hypothetical protein